MSVTIAPTAPDTLREFLMACRDRISVSQERVAIEVGVSGRHYGALERGQVRNPNPVLVNRVAEVLRMSEAEQERMQCLLQALPAA
ncbi:helix-turn-helix domain-containing protein [Kitasatospora aureofaciens]|uniref:helix-turn-helix domain-containing protein n=1 Tax=Kitasatospora aureofaciens TaxID=1894 RepID=UPI0005272A40|nr:helix-turn-helix transcriptional regulator [Kitasatospora aureofaciens]